MTFSKVPVMGQAFLETLVGLSVLVVTSLTGILIVLQGIGTLVLTRWAAQNCLCVAIQNDPSACAQTTKTELSHSFAFKKIFVTSKTVRGTIHSDVQAWIGSDVSMKATYDLGASEYKRVSP